MKVTCTKCGALYKIDETKLDGKPSRFTCKKCGNKQVIYPPGLEPKPATNPSLAAAEGEIKKTNVKTAAGLTAVEEKTAEAQKEWFLALDGERLGPFTFDEAKTLVAENKNAPRMLGWKNGFPSWKKLPEIDDFAPVLAELESQKRRTELLQKVADDGSIIAPAKAPLGGAKTEFVEPAKTLSEMKAFIDIPEPEPIASASKPKLDLESLAKIDNVAPRKPTAPRKRISSGMPMSKKAATRMVEEYKPPEVKKISILPFLLPPIALIVIFSIVLTFAYFRIIEVPAFVNLPVIGHHFVVKKFGYADLTANYDQMIKVREENIRMENEKMIDMTLEEAKKQIEEERAINEERRRRLEEKMASASAFFSKKNVGGGKNQLAAMEFNFEADDELATDGKALGDGKGENLQPLTQAKISEIVSSNMKQISQCLQYSREVYKENFTGEYMVGWTVSFRGTVRNVRFISGGDVRRSFLADCIMERISRWRFPKSGGNVQVQYPFTFK